MAAEIHVNDEPILRATIKDQDGAAVDISSATNLIIKLKKPSAASVARTATLTVDGTDGQMQYQVVALELDEAAEWERQAQVTLGGKPYSSDIDRFPVQENL